MPGKVVPCALCQTGAAAVYCVNDDANLCTECDASVHAGNPLLARHERRPLSAMACQAECASAACTAATDCTDADVCVVPQFGAAATPAAPAAAATKAEPEAAPLVLYEDAFLGRSLTTSDLLDLDELELPGCTSPSAFSFDDCVVPSFGAWAPPAGGDRYLQVPDSPRDEPFAPAYAPSYLARAPQPYLVKQHGGAGGMVPTAAGHGATKPTAAHMTDAEAEAERVRRHRERQRKKRAFGRAVRYQVRRVGCCLCCCPVLTPSSHSLNPRSLAARTPRSAPASRVAL